MLTPNEALNLDPSPVLGSDGKLNIASLASTAAGAASGSTPTAPDFAGSLWDQTDKLLEIYAKRLNTLERLSTFFREKAALDEEYARSLTALVDKVKLPATEGPQSDLAHSLSQFAQCYKALAIQQETVARRALTNLADRLRIFCNGEMNEFQAAKRRLDAARTTHEEAIVQLAQTRAQAFSAAATSIAARRKVRVAARLLAENPGFDNTPSSKIGGESNGISLEQFENLQRHAALSDSRARSLDEGYQQEVNAAVEHRVALDAAIADTNSMIQKKLAHRTVVASRALLSHAQLMKAHASLTVDTLTAISEQLLGAPGTAHIKTITQAVIEEQEAILKQLETDAAPEPYPTYQVPPGHPDSTASATEEADDEAAVAFAANAAAEAQNYAQQVSQKYAGGLTFASLSISSDLNGGLNAALDTIESTAKETALKLQAALTNMFASTSADSSSEGPQGAENMTQSSEAHTSRSEAGVAQSSGGFQGRNETGSPADDDNELDPEAIPGAIDAEAKGDRKHVAREYIEKEIARIIEGALGCEGLLTGNEEQPSPGAFATPKLPDEDLQLAKSLFSTNDGRNACAFVLNKLRKYHHIQFTEAGVELLAKVLQAFLDSTKDAMHVRPAQLIMILSQTLYCLDDSGTKRFLQQWIKSHPIWRSMRFWNEAFCEALSRQIVKQRDMIRQRFAQQEQEEAERQRNISSLSTGSTQSGSSAGSFISMFAPSYLMQTLGLAESEPAEVVARRERLRQEEDALEEAKQEAAFALLGTFASNMADFEVPPQYIRAFANKMAINTGLKENHIAILQGLPVLNPNVELPKQ